MALRSLPILALALMALAPPPGLARPLTPLPEGAVELRDAGSSYPSLVLNLPASPDRTSEPSPAPRSLPDALFHHQHLLGGLDARHDFTPLGPLRPFGSGLAQGFTQVHRGIPIEDRGGWLWLGQDGATKALRLTLAPRPEGDATPEVSEALALAQALSHLGLDERPATASLVYWPGGTQSTEGPPPRLSWRVHLSPYAALHEDWFVYIDALNGAVIFAEDRALEAGAADIFPQNPVVDDWTTSLTNLEAFGALDPARLKNERVDGVSCLDRHRLIEVESDYGPVDVHVCSVTQGAFPDSSGDYRFTPDYLSTFDPFSEVQAFYHANLAIDFFAGLGATDLSTVPLQVLVNYQAPDGYDVENMSDPFGTLLTVTNAYFTGGSVPGEEGEHPPRLLFGQGANADIAYDGDVVYHEFGHAVVAALNGPRRTALGPYGQINEAPALNEGTADYFACALTEDPLFAEYGSYKPDREGVGGWRDLDNTYNCQDDITAGAHGDGRIWSGALWQVRSGAAAGREAEFDEAVVDALRGMGPTASFQLAGTLLLAIVEDRFPSEVGAALKAELEQRYILGGCPRWRDAEGGPSSLSAPGRGSLTVSGPAPGALQLRVEVPEGGGDLVIRGHQSQGAGSRLHMGSYDKNTNPNLRILARQGEPISYREIGGTAVGVYDVDAPLLPTGEVYETLYTDFYEYEARVPVDDAGSWYILLGSNDASGGAIIWMEYEIQGRQEVRDTQPASLGAGPTLEKAHLRCSVAAPGGGAPAGALALLGLVLGARFRRRARGASEDLHP